MTDYRPPLKDIAFTLEHVVGYDRVAALPGYEHADLDTVVGMLEEAGDFMAKVVAPVNRDGDLIGAVRNPDGTVTTPDSFKTAYTKLVESGWGSVPFPEEFEGGGFPWVVGLALQELLQTSSLAFALGPLLTQGAIDALLHYGSDEQKAVYLPKMVSGEWTGTMNLTEPQAGTDVGALATKAVPNGDGTYAITGQKIFITYGDHDLTDQIVHLVLARTPGAPEGTKGISCFIVPKYLLDEHNEPGERNAVQTLALEHKVGIHGSPTAQLSYEGATGYLIGEEHKGMRIMFVMMNSARISVGMQGLAIGVRAYQQALEYAGQRVQGEPIGPSGDATISGHPDVRRMLMTQKAYIAALRRLLLLTAVNNDLSKHAPDEAERTRATEIVGLLTPIAKSWGTDLGVELSSLGIQIHGGMGFIEETGAAQHWRDSRITPIYEGTNGVQAADLVGRKMPVRMGQSFLEYIASLREILPELEAAGGDLALIGAKLGDAVNLLERVTGWMLKTGASGDVASVLAGSVAYLNQWGETLGAWLLAKSALAAAGLDDADEAAEQLALAKFFATHLLPKTTSLAAQATAGADDVFAIPLAKL